MALAESETMRHKASELCTQGFTTLPMTDLRPLIRLANDGFTRFLEKDERKRRLWTSWRRKDPRDGTPDDGYLPRDGTNGKDIKTSFHTRKDLMDILVNENGLTLTTEEVVWVENLVAVNRGVRRHLMPLYEALGSVLSPDIPRLANSPTSDTLGVFRMNAYQAPRLDAPNDGDWQQIGQSHRDRAILTVAMFESNEDGDHDNDSRLERYDGSFRLPPGGIMSETVKAETRIMRDADTGHWHLLTPTPEEAVVFASSGLEEHHNILAMLHRILCRTGKPVRRRSFVHFEHLRPMDETTLSSHFA